MFGKTDSRKNNEFLVKLFAIYWNSQNYMIIMKSEHGIHDIVIPLVNEVS